MRTSVAGRLAAVLVIVGFWLLGLAVAVRDAVVFAVAVFAVAVALLLLNPGGEECFGRVVRVVWPWWMGALYLAGSIAVYVLDSRLWLAWTVVLPSVATVLAAVGEYPPECSPVR